MRKVVIYTPAGVTHSTRFAPDAYGGGALSAARAESIASSVRPNATTAARGQACRRYKKDPVSRRISNLDREEAAPAVNAQREPKQYGTRLQEMLRPGSEPGRLR